LNKADFKIWQPWLHESNLPKWAQDLQEQPLNEVLAQDLPEFKKTFEGNVELPLQFYQAFKVKDRIQEYADLRPKACEPRLTEIYRKFAQKIKEFGP
jgi:hypothetical protein